MTQQLAQRIRLRETIGESNYATTRLAYDPERGKRVVVKTLDLSRVSDEKVIELFEREARVLSNLEHPRIPKFVGVYEERDESGRRVNLVQEYVDGVDLQRVIENGRHFTEAEVIRIGSELASILVYLHGFSPSIIHRDIKPSNVILDENDEVWLIDFGGARDRMMQDHLPEGGGMTIVGSYGYMPYEQFEGRAVPQSDVYSLGATLLFLLSHKHPADFDKEGMRLKIAGETNASKRLVRVLEKALAPDWSDRHASAAELKLELDALRGVVAPRKQPYLVAAAAAVLLCVAGLMVLSDRSEPASTSPAFVAQDAFAAPRQPLPGREIEAATGPTVVLVGDHVVEGKLLFDGRPIGEFTHEQPHFWLRNEDKGTVQSAGVKYQDGAIRIYALEPGRYGLSVRIDAIKDKAMTWPGDFDSFVTFVVVADKKTQVNVNLYKIMRLRRPVDNSDFVAADTGCDAMREHAGAPLTFEWDSLGDGVEYAYRITKLACPYTRKSIVEEGRTTSTRLELKLEPSGDGEFYMFDLDGFSSGKRVGKLQVRGNNFLGWDYRFRVPK